MYNIYVQKEAKKNFDDWTKEGLGFLLQNENYRDIAIKTLSKLGISKNYPPNQIKTII